MYMYNYTYTYIYTRTRSRSPPNVQHFTSICRYVSLIPGWPALRKRKAYIGYIYDVNFRKSSFAGFVASTDERTDALLS